MNELILALKKEIPQTQYRDINPENYLPEALKIRLPRCSYLQLGNPTIIGRTDSCRQHLSYQKKTLL